MNIRRHSMAAQTILRDLLDLLLDDEVSGIRGVPTLRKRGTRSYWYDRYRIGSDVKERFLGEDEDAIRSRIDTHVALRAERESRMAERSKLVRLLRAERVLGADPTTGSLLSAMASAGFFRLGGVLVGTNAFRLYEGELGLRLGRDQGVATRDIDIASFERVSLALAQDETASSDTAAIFKDFSFEPAPTLDPKGRGWRWRQTRGEAIVEFLTPSFTANEEVRSLPALGVSAQSLHYLNFLIGDPIPAALVYRDGVLVKIPRPERYAIHKLIVADRRSEGSNAAKARKDRMQAEILIEVLSEERPERLAASYIDARGRGARWRARLDRSLDRSPEAKARLDRLL